MKTYVSSVQRLMHLPDVFRGSDLTIRFQWSSKTASQYLYLWRRRGLIQPLGGHSDVYANLLLAPHPNWEKAARLAMPSATLIGLESLRRAGWITQIVQRPQVAVSMLDRRYAIEPYEVVTRPPSWFECCRAAILRQGPEALPVLHPAWSLIDLLKHEGWQRCGLDPDDLDWESIQDRDALRAACEVLDYSFANLQPRLENEESTHGCRP